MLQALAAMSSAQIVSASGGARGGGATSGHVTGAAQHHGHTSIPPVSTLGAAGSQVLRDVGVYRP